MKRWTVVVLLLWLLTPVCLGAEAEFGMDGLWSAAEEYGVDADAGLEAGLDRLGEQALEEGGTYLRRSLRVGAELMAVVMLLSAIRFEQSPRWLLSKGRREEADHAARYFLGQDVEIGEVTQPQQESS